jgi:transposase
MVENRKGYDREFKISAVKMIIEEGRSIREVSESLGLNYHTLRDWKIAYETNGAGAFQGNGIKVYGSDSEKEISELKKKIRRLEMERDILKKAMAISLEK